MTVTFKIDGGITCIVHPGDPVIGRTWCDHIGDALASREDADSVWDHGVGSDPWQPNIAVPLMPTRGIWAIVRLHKIEEQDGSVNALRASLIAPWPQGITEPVDLGFLSHGEGRMMLREMIIDWFYPELSHRTIQCSSPHHTLYRTMQITGRMAGNDAHLFVNRWLMFHYSMCEYCWEDASRPARQGETRFPADMVPPSI